GKKKKKTHEQPLALRLLPTPSADASLPFCRRVISSPTTSHFPRSLPSTARRLRLGENPATGMQGGNRSSSPTVSHASFHRLCASPVSALPFAVAAPRRPPPPVEIPFFFLFSIGYLQI
ncbi:Os07g0253100, partial [Oryza sativa Japonica Group]